MIYKLLEEILTLKFICKFYMQGNVLFHCKTSNKDLSSSICVVHTRRGGAVAHGHRGRELAEPGRNNFVVLSVYYNWKYHFLLLSFSMQLKGVDWFDKIEEAIGQD